MNKLVKTVPRQRLYKEFLMSLNGILGLTNRELELLTLLVDIDVNTPKSSTESKNVISAANRKYIRKILGITPDNISRYIAKFKRKGLLQHGTVEDEVFVNKALIPEIINDRIQVTIILKIGDEREN